NDYARRDGRCQVDRHAIAHARFSGRREMSTLRPVFAIERMQSRLELHLRGVEAKSERIWSTCPKMRIPEFRAHSRLTVHYAAACQSGSASTRRPLRPETEKWSRRPQTAPAAFGV